MSSATTLSTRSGHASSQEMLHLVLRIGLLPILMAIVIIGTSLLSPYFLGWMNVVNILRMASFLAIIACGQALVIIAGGFDLSVIQGGDTTAMREMLKGGAELALRLYEFPIPVVMACTGHAIASSGSFHRTPPSPSALYGTSTL